MSLRYGGVDQVNLGSQSLEEEIAARSICICLYVKLRQVWL